MGCAHSAAPTTPQGRPIVQMPMVQAVIGLSSLYLIVETTTPFHECQRARVWAKSLHSTAQEYSHLPSLHRAACTRFCHSYLPC